MSKDKSRKAQKRTRKTVRQMGATRKVMRKHSVSNNTTKSLFVQTFLEVLNMVKLYHWRTHSFAEHKATDDLYGSLNDHIDAFMEVLMGKDESRVKMLEKRIRLMDMSNSADLKKKIYEFRDFLVDMDAHLDATHDTDLLNIRDEILADINKFLYLLTLHK